MAKTVDQFSTLEQFRQTYNDLANSVGDYSGLTTDRKTTIVDAINSIEEKTFYFQEFIFTATASQTSFDGEDDFENTLRFRRNKIQVFVDTDLLYEDVDYTIAQPDGNAHEQIQLIGSYASGLSAGQKLTVFSFTGSFLGTDIADALVGYFSENNDGTIYNTNDTGVILNPTSLNATTVLTDPTADGEYKLEAAGSLYIQDKLRVNDDTDLDGNVNITGNVTIDGGNDLTIKDSGDNDVFTVDGATGNVTLAGSITVGDADTDNVVFNADINSHFVPDVDNTYDIGDENKEWRNLYLDGTAHIDTLDVDESATIASNLDVGGTLDVTGAATLSNNLSVGGTLIVTEATTLNGNVTLGDDPSDTVTITGGLNAHLTVSSGGVFNLGDSSAKFANVYSDELHGNLTGDVTGNLTGDLTGDVYASNGTSKVLESGTNGTDATFTGDVTGQVSDISNHNIGGLSNVDETGASNGKFLKYDGTNWIAADVPDSGVLSVTAGDGLSNSGTAENPELDVNASNGITINSDNVELDYEIVSSAPTDATGTSTGHLWFVVTA